MGGILDKLDEWLRGLLADGIKGNLTGMFDSVKTEVGEIAGQVGMTPQAWNGGVFSMIQNLSETVIVLTCCACYRNSIVPSNFTLTTPRKGQNG